MTGQISGVGYRGESSVCGAEFMFPLPEILVQTEIPRKLSHKLLV